MEQFKGIFTPKLPPYNQLCLIENGKVFKQDPISYKELFEQFKYSGLKGYEVVRSMKGDDSIRRLFTRRATEVIVGRTVHNSNSETAEALGISISTVETHLKNVRSGLLEKGYQIPDSVFGLFICGIELGAVDMDGNLKDSFFRRV